MTTPPSSTSPGSPVESLFNDALSVPAMERTAFVAARAGGDAALAERVNRLLRAHTSAESLLPTPPSDTSVAAELDLEDPLIGQTLGSFKLGALVGAGGMGAVYDAVQESPRRRVALKVLHASLIARDAAHRFRLEAEVLGALEHPGIAHVYEAGVATLAMGRIPYLAMEFVDGATLLEHAKRRELALPARVELFISVCEAVEHAHRKGVIHRDLKPGNIMVTAAGQTKVLDFGVARLVKAEPGATSVATRVGQLVGTLQYMSPEQVRGDPRAIDTRSDVYSLGVVLYELLASRRPYDFASTSVAEAAAIIKDYDPPSLSQFSPACRGDLETIVRKALSKLPEERYQSAAELAGDLRRYLADEPILARPVSRAYYVRKFILRNKALSAAVVAVFFALLVGVVGMWIGLDRANAATRDADNARLAESAALAESRRHEAEATRSAAAAEFQSYVANLAAASGAIDAFDISTAKRHLAACPTHQRGWEWRHLEATVDDSIERFEPTSAPADRSGVWDLSVSRDGRFMAVSEDSSRVVVWSLEDHRIIRVIEMAGRSKEGVPSVVHGVSLSRDGSILACANAWENVATLWSVENGRLLRRLEGHTNEVEDIEFAPDDRTVYTASFDGTVGIWSAADGQSVGSLVGHGGSLRSVSLSEDGRRLVATTTEGVGFAWSLHDRRLMAKSPASGKFGGVSKISPDGTRVLSSRLGNSPWIWDAETGRTLLVLQGHRTHCEGLAWSPDGTLVATGGRDRAVRIHNATDGTPVAAYRGHENSVSNMTFLPDGLSLVSGGFADTSGVHRWPTTADAGLIAVEAHPGDISEITFSPDGRTMSSIGTRWGTVVVQSVATGDILGVVRTGSPAVCATFLSSREIAIACENGAVERWGGDARPGTVAPGSSGPLVSGKLALSDDLLSLYYYPRWPTTAARAWRLDGEPVPAPPALGLKGIVDSDGSLAVRYSATDEVEVVELATGASVWKAPLSPAKNLPYRVCVSWAAGCCAIQVSEQDLALVELRTGRRLALLSGALTHAHSIGFSPDGSRVAIGTRVGDTHLWSVAQAAPVFTLHADVTWVEVAKFSPDGESLVTADSRGVLRTWETSTRAPRIRDSAKTAAARRAADSAFRAALAAGIRPEDAATSPHASGLSPEVRAEVARLAAAYPGTVQGTLDWVCEILADPTVTAEQVRRVGSQIAALGRYRTSSARLQVVASLYHLRRMTAMPEGSEEATTPPPLDSARRRLETARQSLENADERTRRWIDVVSVLVARASGESDAYAAASRTLANLGPPRGPTDKALETLEREARE